jgi:cobalt-zinc-cadmium efflux system outer membrane protein
MKLWTRVPACALLVFCWPSAICAQEWTESQIIEKFLKESPYAREARASVEAVRAEFEGRTLLPNPAAVASREGAGYAAFFQLEQQLPISGRRGILKQAGASAVSAAQAGGAGFLWRLRTDLRTAFYRLLSAQTREGVLAGGTQELEEVVRILRVREAEGEGSRYDRLRGERELAEYRSQLAAARADVVGARAAVLAFLPEAANVARVTGSLQTIAIVPPFEDLIPRAFTRRADFLTEQKQIEQYRLEAKAAERLRIPEPLAIAGLKRGDVSPGRTETSTAVGITVPLPLFNKGKTEVAKWTAEQERAIARHQALERRIRAEVAGAIEALQLRKGAIDQYRREVDPIGTDLSRITLTAYQEGEIGILELLDSYRVNRQARLRALELEMLAKEAAIELDRAVGEEVAP